MTPLEWTGFSRRTKQKNGDTILNRLDSDSV